MGEGKKWCSESVDIGGYGWTWTTDPGVM